MSNSAKAKSLFDGLVDEDMQKAIDEAKEEVTEVNEQFIVYFIGDKPNCVWQHFSNPEDGLPLIDDDGNEVLDDNGKVVRKPYGRQYGYWTDAEKGKASEFKENVSNNLKLMDFDTFMDRVPPNKDCTKVFETEADFLLELI